MKIYMFHYVNDKSFKYYHFDIKMLDSVIKKLKADGKKFISFSEFKQRLNRNDNLNNCVLLTFDDGTKDHYYNVYPILKENNISGLFFISSNIINKKILDINLIHRIISSTDFDILYKNFLKKLDKYEIDDKLNENTVLTAYDDERMRYFKQMLQFLLPDNIRMEILYELARENNVRLNFDDYYMTESQILEMKANGMEFGFHSLNHKRLEKLTKEEQKVEIFQDYYDLLNKKLIEKDCAFAYPFGGYNNETINLLKELEINYSFAIEHKDFMKNDNLLKIPRYDCNVLKGDDFDES